MNSPETERRLHDSIIQRDSDECLIGNSSSSINSPSSTPVWSLEARQLRQELRFFFKNPIEKWNTGHRFPYKFMLQVIKIVLVTFQLCIFAESRYNHMNYAVNNRLAFSHLFVNLWDATREVANYPPVAGPLALYTKSDFYESVDFAVQQFGNLSDSIGSYSHLKEENETIPLKLCLRHRDLINAADSLSREREDCFNVTVESAVNFSIANFSKSQTIDINFKKLIEVTINFSLIAQPVRPEEIRCCKFMVEILFDNRNMDGQLVVSLNSNLNRLPCPGDFNITKEAEFWSNVLNTAVIIVCSCSLVLCLRSIIRAQILLYKTIDFFRRIKRVELSTEGRFEFWNFWFIMIIVNDILIIIGSIVEAKIARNEYTTEEWSVCSLCLGTGNMLVWFGVLRYFGFFKTYNVVMLTIKRAFPKMTRFLLCTLIIYAGFVFCGWLVLGPFHIKFSSVSRTSENLFSLVNGDDMFATFTILEAPTPIIWWYSRIYLYSFVSLFIYIILNLFLSVILDAYETIKEYYLHGFPKSDLQQFIYESEGDAVFSETMLQDDRGGYNHGLFCHLKKVYDWLRRG